MTEIAPVVETEDVVEAPAVEEAPAPKAPAKKAVAKKSVSTSRKAGEPVYVARRLLTVGEKKYKPGDVVPEANTWTRIETWVRAGYIDVKAD